MQIIAVDFSLNSPGIVVLTQRGLKFISYLKPGMGTKAETKMQEELAMLKDITLKFQPIFETSKDFSEKEISKLYRFITMSNDIISLIDDLDLIDPKLPITIAFEGVSYGSSGGGTNNLIDLAAGAAIFKFHLFTKYNTKERDLKFNIVTVAPTSIKKFAGGGRMNKLELWNSFIENNLKDQVLAKSDVWGLASKLEIGKKVPKPFDDLVDAYYLAMYIKDLNLLP